MPDNQLHARRQAQPLALGRVEKKLRERYPQLGLYLVAEAHYGEEGFAFIHVYNVEDKELCKQIRAEAGDLLGELGFPVELIHGKDVYDIRPMHSD